MQRTKAETVEKFYEGFLQEFPDWNAIAVADISKIEEYLKPIGLYRQRAKRLKNLAMEMVSRNEILPMERNELEELPFFGQYIVNAILLQIFHIPSPLMDVNMSRVLERYFGKRKLADIRYDPYLQKLAYQVVHHKFSKEINWAILDFSASICKAKPLCGKCFLSSNCNFYQNAIKNSTPKLK